MTVTDLDRIEAELSVVLPDRYRTAMIVSPFKGHDEIARGCMPDDVELVLKLNKDNPALRNKPLPKGFVAIGNRNDELFVLDTRDPRGSIILFDTQTLETRELASHFDDWIKMLRRWQNAADPKR